MYAHSILFVILTLAWFHITGYLVLTFFSLIKLVTVLCCMFLSL
nr:MAG TPA: hypothetical protein [Caudoviricetes sp.]